MGFLLGCLAALLGPEFDSVHTILTAIRVAHGQRIYRDLMIPNGPVSTWVLVPFLQLAPSIGWAVIIASGALNAVATAAAWQIAMTAGRGAEAARAAAILTAVWFLPIFGTYYLDHLAYACVLGALTAYLSLRTEVRGVVAGLLLALAYHSKQTVGGPAFLAIIVALWVVDGRRTIQDRNFWWLLSSFALGQALVLGTIGLTGNLSDYLAYACQVPIQHARETGRSIWRLPYALLLPFGINPVAMIRTRGLGRLSFYPVVIAVYCGYFWLGLQYRRWRNEVEEARAPLLAGLALVLSTLWSSILLGRLYSHVTFGVWTLVGSAIADARSRLVRNLVLSLGVILGGVHFAALHWVRPPFRWGLANSELRPLAILNAGAEFDLDGASAAIEYLRGRDGSIALLSDSAAIIPAALSRPTFEPVGYFMDGLTVPHDANHRRIWEERFEQVLEEHAVQFLLWNPRERDDARRLHLEGTALQRFIALRYAPARSFGQYQLLERCPGAECARRLTVAEERSGPQ